MRVVYIRRSEAGALPKRLYKQVRRHLYFNDQDGFFEQSLHTTAEVTEYTWESYIHARIDWSRFDALIVNMKAGSFSDELARINAYKKYVWSAPVPSGLFIGAAKADFMFCDNALDGFKVIFKREPWRDRSRYAIRGSNRDKIVPTMIYCPFAPKVRDNLLSKLHHTFGREVVACSSEPQYDIGFAGRVAANNHHRIEVWRAMVESELATIGGLQDNPLSGVTAPLGLQGSRFRDRAYRDTICDAHVNLALEGIGQFTFRHLELWHLGVCMLSSPSLNELELPIPVKDGEHYHCFTKPVDAVAKAEWLKNHPKERKRVASNGQACYRTHYQPSLHGKTIYTALT